MLHFYWNPCKYCARQRICIARTPVLLFLCAPAPLSAVFMAHFSRRSNGAVSHSFTYPFPEAFSVFHSKRKGQEKGKEEEYNSLANWFSNLKRIYWAWNFMVNFFVFISFQWFHLNVCYRMVFSGEWKDTILVGRVVVALIWERGKVIDWSIANIIILFYVINIYPGNPNIPCLQLPFSCYCCRCSFDNLWVCFHYTFCHLHLSYLHFSLHPLFCLIELQHVR